MYKRRLNLKQCLSLFAMLLSAGMTGQLHALSTDKYQDIIIEADTAEMDDIQGISIYRGNVVVVQGSIRMTGHTMTVYFDDNDDMELVIMQGNPATYRQLPDDSQVYDEAEALQMEYYALKDFVILIDEAIVTQEDSKMTGSRIEYDTVLNQVLAKGVSQTAKGQEGSADKSKDGRVKITIKKKKEPQP